MKKHYTILSAIIFFSFFAKGQLFKSPLNSYWIMYNEELNEPSPLKHHFNFKEMIVKTKKKSTRFIYNYDQEGRLISCLEEKTKDKLKDDDNKNNRGFLVTYVKSEQKLKQKIQYYKNSKVTSIDSFNYNKFNRTTLYTRFDNNQKIKRQDSYAYDSTFLKEHEAFAFKNGKKKILSREIYEYEPDFQLKKITYYNQKNKAYKKQYLIVIQ